MTKHRIVYDTKENYELVRHFKDFDSFADACTFLREIKYQSITKPVLEEIHPKSEYGHHTRFFV